jgi:cytochrome P450
VSVPAPELDFLAAVLSPGFRDDPYPWFHELRSTDPVHQASFGDWLISRYADVAAIVRDPELSTNRRHHRQERERSRAADLDDGFLLFLDPPDHTRIRGLVSSAFTPRRIQQLRPGIAALVESLLDAAAARGLPVIDVIADLAEPLPVVVICELLGVPAEDRELFRGWSRELSALVDLQPMRTAEQEARIELAAAEFADYFVRLIGERRRRPGDDLLTALIAAGQQGERLSERELLDTALFLLIAGHETTINLIGNGMLALLRHPDELARLHSDPSLDRGAVEELLRFDSPVQLTQRITIRETEIGGVLVPAGQTLIPLLGAANRDPAAFPEPDRLDLSRNGAHRHVGFGGGRHYCLGAALARLEGELAIGGLVRRFAELEPVGEPRRRRTFTLRGLETLPVAVVTSTRRGRVRRAR